MAIEKVLNIIVPCYNPDTGWEMIVVEKFNELKAALPGTKIKMILVNDGSVTGVDEAMINYIKSRIEPFQVIEYHENKGKGYALRQGVKTADGDFYIYTDIDFPYTIQSMAEIFRCLLNGADVVVGIRESEYYSKVPVRRVIISKLVKSLIRYLLSTPITDTQCGLKGFNRKGRSIFLQTTINRFLFDMQFVKLASNNKSISVRPQIVYARPGIVFSHMNYKMLLGESVNFIRLISLSNY